MLLLINSLNLAGVWIGEIKKNREEVRKLCNSPQNFECQGLLLQERSREKPLLRYWKTYTP